MNSLLSSLTKFLTTTMELYQLPYELTTDLHTLNAYLKSYTPAEETLLQGFVNRQVQKLEQKLKKKDREQGICVLNIKTDDQYPKYAELANKKYETMRIQIPTELSEHSVSSNLSCLDRSQNDKHSHRSGRSTKAEGIKSDRHKFGTRQRNKTQKALDQWYNKENISSTNNLKIEPVSGRQFKLEEKPSLKPMRSQTELLHNAAKDLFLERQSSTENRKDDHSKPRVRYESYQSKGHPHTSSLKIKLKLKPTLDLCKLAEDIKALWTNRQTHDAWMEEWWEEAGRKSEDALC